MINFVVLKLKKLRYEKNQRTKTFPSPQKPIMSKIKRQDKLVGKIFITYIEEKWLVVLMCKKSF